MIVIIERNMHNSRQKFTGVLAIMETEKQVKLETGELSDPVNCIQLITYSGPLPLEIPAYDIISIEIVSSHEQWRLVL